MSKSIEIFQALDHLFCKPDNPDYEEIKNNSGDIIGYNLKNMIAVAPQFGFVSAIKDQNRHCIHLVFGKYPVMSFLLRPIGRMMVKDENLKVNR